MKYFVYVATGKSMNEGQGYSSLEFIAEAETWEAAYKIMVEQGNILKEHGFKESVKSRSKMLSKDGWIEPVTNQQDWKDLHHKEVLVSAFKLSLAER